MQKSKFTPTQLEIIEAVRARKVGKLTNTQWAWAFMRRDPEYKLAYERRTRKSDPAEFHLRSWIDPCTPERDVGSDPDDLFVDFFRFIVPTAKRPTGRLISTTIGSFAADTEVAVVFDVARRIEPQVARAEVLLNKRGALYRKLMDGRLKVPNRKELVEMFDAFDLRGAGLSYKQICELISVDDENTVTKRVRSAERLFKDRQYLRLPFMKDIR